MAEKDKGWVRIYRSITDCAIWASDQPFDRRSAWIDLILMANHEDRSILVKGHMVDIHRGQKLTSVRKLANRWHWSKDRVERYLALLKQLKMCDTQRDTNSTLITIVKYGDFQSFNYAGKDTDKDTHKDTRKDNGKDTSDPQTIMQKNVHTRMKEKKSGSSEPVLLNPEGLPYE